MRTFVVTSVVVAMALVGCSDNGPKAGPGASPSATTPAVSRHAKGSGTNKSIEGDRQDLAGMIYGSGGGRERRSQEVALAGGHDGRARATAVGWHRG